MNRSIRFMGERFRSAGIVSDSQLTREVLESLPDPLIVWDGTATPVLFTARARPLLPAELHEVPPQLWAEHYLIRRPDGAPFHPPMDLPVFRALRGEVVHDAQLLIGARGDNPGRLVSVDAAPVPHPDGPSDGALTIMRDITDAAQALPRAELLAGLVEHMPYAVCIVRASDGTILYANPSWARRFGYALGEPVGIHLSAVSSAADETTPGELVRHVLRRLAEYGSWSGLVEQVRKDGSRFWCDETIWAYDDARAGGVWAVVYGEQAQR